MSKKRQVKSTSAFEMQESVPPSETQLAELHSLLAESEQLAYAVNYPISSLAFSLVTKAMSKFVPVDSLLSSTKTLLVDWLGIADVDAIPLITLICITPPAIFLYTKLFSAIATLIKKVFPNGFTLSREQHSAYSMQRKLGTSAELTEAITSLKKLIDAQKTSSNRTFYAAIAVNLIIPILSSMFIRPSRSGFRAGLQSGRLQLSMNLMGPHLIFHAPGAPVSNFINSLAGNQQGLRFLASLKTLWSDFNTPKQLEHYTNKLKRLSCSAQDWSYNRNDRKSKALFCLVLAQKKLQCLDQDEQAHWLSRSAYVTELHRILLEEQLPIYCIGKDKIYVGYARLPDKQVDNIRHKLFIRLKEAAKQENAENIALAQLHQLTAALARNLTWESHSSYNSKNQLETYYFLNCPSLSSENQALLERALSEIIPNPKENMSNDRDIFKIKNFPTDLTPENLAEKIVLLQKTKHSSVPLPAIPQPTNAASSNMPSQEDTKRQVSKVTQGYRQHTLIPEGKSAPTKHETTALLFDSKQYQIYKEGMDKAAENVVFPLHAPWLPEGRVYAKIVPAVFEATQSLVSQDAIFARLEAGIVHGRRIKHTKQGSVGIQVSRQPYRDTEGKAHISSGLKLKIDNVRIFGRPVTKDQEQHQLYVFDGPAYGH